MQDFSLSKYSHYSEGERIYLKLGAKVQIHKVYVFKTATTPCHLESVQSGIDDTNLLIIEG